MLLEQQCCISLRTYRQASLFELKKRAVSLSAKHTLTPFRRQRRVYFSTRVLKEMSNVARLRTFKEAPFRMGFAL